MKVVVVPPAPVLQARYRSQIDPIAQLRAAVASAVSWLGPARVVADTPHGARIGAELLGDRAADGPGYLVLANGSARRTEKAPGFFDQRAADFDSKLGTLLATGAAVGLAEVDQELATELLAEGWQHFADLAELKVTSSEIVWSGDPFGVQYWVVRWQCDN